MKKIILTFVLLISGICIFPQSNEDNYTQKKIDRYLCSAKEKPFFIPLEIGEIAPKGWLLDWANSAANGITGHLDEYVDVFKHGWKGFGFKARGVNEADGTGWPLEQCSYWLDGAVKLGYILHDTLLINKTSSRLNLVVDSVLNGGETFIYWKPKSIVNDGFNNWGHALMGRALVSYYQATHNKRILQALVKVYKSFPLLTQTEKSLASLNKSTERMRGATNIDAMTETYLMSGEQAILDSIIAYGKKDETTKTEKQWLELNPLNKTKKTEGVHGVSFYEVLRVPAMIYPWSGNLKELETAKNIFKWGEEKNILPFGVCSSEEYLAGIGSFRNAETCNVPTSMWTFLWMLRLTGESSWSDKIEKVFFNAGAAPVARDFKTMCYYQSPNRFSNKLPEVVPVPGTGDLDFTDHGHEVLCCVGNINNSIPDYISSMWMATLDNGLAAVLYGPCSIQKKINHADIKIDCNTAYPFDDKIEMTAELSEEVELPLYFRIPEWCQKASITINEKAYAAKAENGFVKIKRTWKNKDKIELVFPMMAQIHKGVETAYPEVPYFAKRTYGRENLKDSTVVNVNNPYETVTYGPLLFALPIKDINPNLEVSGEKFNYALNINPKQIEADVVVIKNPINKVWSWKLEDAPIKLKVKAKEFNWQPAQVQPLPDKPIKEGMPAFINLVPYGCAKFRVTMFPVTEESWNVLK